MTKILEDVKRRIGIADTNVGFDEELLGKIRAAASVQVQLGVDVLNLVIESDTEWPSFGSESLSSFSKEHITAKTKRPFDPSASEAINRILDDYISELESRIAFEIEDLNNV